MIFAGGSRGRSAMESDAMSEISEMSSKSKKSSRFRTNKKKDVSKDLSKSQKEALKAQMRLDKALAAANMDEFPSPDDKEDPALRFAGDGVTFKAKLIGVDPVTGPRGDQMCRNAMTRLKAIVKGTGSHKQKIILSISLDGLKLMDEKTREVISQHPIPLISYISRDTSDSRAFGFVYGSPSEGHQFIGIKTEKQAIPVMQTIADLFTYVYEKRKKEKAKEKENHNRSEPVLSFNPKEEVFSEQKVNAAWKQSEPKITNSSSSSSSPVSIPVLPPLLPPPRSAAESVSSRASTLNSSQKSDMLSDLRAMRHVIQSAQVAAASNTSSCDRYATWESFNEAEANDTIGNFQSHLQQHNRNGGMGSAMSLDSNRPSSAISDHSSVSYSGRGGIAPRLPSSVLPAVPSPPSSPRSSVSARARMRPRRGFEQPNQVALPPPNVTVGASSLSLQTRSGMYPLQPTESSSSVFPSTAAYHQAHPINSTFPAQSTPDLFSQFNQRVSSNTTDKFEVNFDAVFSSFPSGPSSSQPPTTSVSSTNVGSLFGAFTSLTSAMTATTTTQSTYSMSSSTSTLTSASADRYACLAEIQNLANYPSIFDNHPTSSGSDSDTFVGSPPSSSAENVSNANGLSENSDMFGATNWSTSATNTQGPNTAGLGVPLIPAPRTEDQYKVERPSLIDFNRQEGLSSLAAQSEHDNSQLNKSPRFVDTATSPGTPPSSSSHANKSQSKGQQINSRGSTDAFSMSSLLVELDGNKANLSDSSTEKSHDTSGNRSKDTTTIMTKRVCHTENIEDRAVSPASSITSNHSRNPFASEEETDRSGDFATDATGSSAHRSGEAASRPSPYSTSSSSTSKGVTPCGHPCFDPFSCHHHHASPYDASQFPSPRQFPPSQFMCHHYHGMPHPPSMYSLPPHAPRDCPQCSSGFCYRPDYFHYDMRYPQQYKQNPIYYSQQVFSSPQSANKPTHPTDFGPSFDFGDGFDSKSPSEIHSFQPTHHSHRPHHIYHSETASNRSLSPNNPFSPVFPPPGSHTNESGLVPPPRPPARIEARRPSQESDTPPPPLPKRKPVNGPMPQPIGHFYPYPMYGYPSGPIHPGPDMHQHQYHAGTDAPPIPLPSRKKTGSTSRPGGGSTIERRVSFDAPLSRPPPEDPFDPFNVTYVDKELNRLSTIKRQASMEAQKTSTPVNSAGGPVPPLLPINAHSISTIRSMEDSQSGQSESHNLQNDNDSVFFSSPSGGPTPAATESGSGGTEAEDVAYARLDDSEANKKDEPKMNTKDDKQESATEIAKTTTTTTTTTNTGSAGAPISFNHFGEDHISPPERNIFREKDPFADDDFFTPTTTT